MKETITALRREMKRRGIFAFVGFNSIKQTALSEKADGILFGGFSILPARRIK